MTRKEDLLERFMALPPDERDEFLVIATARNQRSRPADEDAPEEIWDPVLERRLQEIKDGTAELVPHDRVMARARTIIEDARGQVSRGS